MSYHFARSLAGMTSKLYQYAYNIFINVFKGLIGLFTLISIGILIIVFNICIFILAICGSLIWLLIYLTALGVDYVSH